ncbi:MAG: hypothetical protein JWM90_3032 [Thermoleophilia bacterium]|nr:hypothetical protein [Thermoleophilia bacterium]
MSTVAFRLVTNVPATQIPEQSHWRFVASTLALAVVLLAAVAGFNAWMDTTGTLGTGQVDPIAALPRDRAAKVTLVERVDSPELVVLGSSRAKRLDPRELGPAGARGVNAAAVGADLLEARVLTRWLADRVSGERPFPHLVVGVDVEQFRSSSLRESGMLAVPEVADVAREEARADGDGDAPLLPLLDDLLLTWSATRTSIAAAFEREQLEREAARAAEDPNEITRTQPVDLFDGHGLLRSDARFAKASVRTAVAAQLPRELTVTVSDYQGRYRGFGAEPSADAFADFRAMIEIAREQGDTPLIYLTPMHPSVQAALRPLQREARRQAVLEFLRSEEAKGGFRFVDCSLDCVGDDPLLWSDGVHLTPAGARVLARELRTRVA